MIFAELLNTVGEEPVFDTGLLLAGNVDPAEIRRQLSRWARSGRIFQLRRGLYALAPPFQKVKPFPFVVANRLVHGSYVSLQSALAHFGLIPEHVPVTTSVTIGRPGRRQTPLGTYEFRHVHRRFLTGYRRLELGDGKPAWVASPEKALLDLIHLEPQADTPEYLAELRLQHLNLLNLAELTRQAESLSSPKLVRAAERVARMADQEAREYKLL